MVGVGNESTCVLRSLCVPAVVMLSGRSNANVVGAEGVARDTGGVTALLLRTRRLLASRWFSGDVI